MNIFHPILKTDGNLSCLLVSSSVSAGFPSPADDYWEPALDLNQYLVKHPEATFLVRVSGDSMIQAGIFSGDVLIVDRSLSVRSGDTIIAIVDREFLVKKFLISNGQHILRSANPKYPDLIISSAEMSETIDYQVWGIVTYCLHVLHR